MIKKILSWILAVFLLVSIVTAAGSGVTEDIPISKGIAFSEDGFDWQLDDSDLPTFQDTQIEFVHPVYGIADYDVHDELAFITYSPSIETSLSTSDDDYESNVFMEVRKKGIYYVYSFDDFIDLTQVSEENPLIINFLGRYLKIIGVFPGTNGIQIDFGDEIKTYITSDPYIDEDPLIPNWKWYITNLDVTDGATEIDSESPAQGVINASANSGPVIAIYNYFRTTSSSDNPAGIGECYSLPNDYANLCFDSLNVADGDYLSTTIKYVESPGLDEANYPGVTVANTAVEISAPLDTGFTVVKGDEEIDEGEYFMDVGDVVIVDSKQITLSNVGSDGSVMVDVDGTIAVIPSLGTEIVNEIEITNIETYYEDTKSERAAILNIGSPTAVPLEYINTDKIWITKVSNGFEIFYRDKDVNPQIQHLGSMSGTLGYINYGENNNKISLSYEGDLLSSFVLNIVIEGYEEYLTAKFTGDASNIRSLGNTLSLEESDELIWSSSYIDAYGIERIRHVAIGVKDEDHRMKYGTIIKDPKSNGGSDQVVLEMPIKQVQANVIIQGPDSAIVNVDPVQNIIAGREFSINVAIDTKGTEVYAGQFELKFDPNYLEVVRVTEGSFLNFDGADTYPIIDIESDRIVFANTRLNVASGANGSGDLAVIDFKAKKKGNTVLNFNNVELADTEANPIVVSSEDESLYISSLYGDVNDDSMVNIIDLATVGQAFGSVFGDANYNDDADLNGDSQVNIYDLAIVGMNFGK